jgi:Uma2 family endonuclease
LAVVTPATVVSAEEYERIALAEPERRWELHAGRLVEKPPMSQGHDLGQLELVTQLIQQLDPKTYKVQFAAKLRRGDGNYFIPDVCVIPVSMIEPDRERRRRLNVYADPVPLVVEVWSPSTGDYDIEVKLAEYQRRGDQEILRLRYFERTLSTWRRQPDGSYVETEIHDRAVSPVAFPWVTIDLDAVFA